MQLGSMHHVGSLYILTYDARKLNILFYLHICASRTAFVVMYSFVNDFPEADLQGPKQGKRASQNNKWLFEVTCAISWIKYCVIKLLHGIWITLNG